MATRGEFSSRLGFVLAASGSAIGLGNIWGFPIQVASNGGGAFLFTYLVLTFLLAYPVLMAEIVIGRYAKKDIVNSMLLVGDGRLRGLSYLTGYWGILVAALILSFYAIVAGWMIAWLSKYALALLMPSLDTRWLTDFSWLRNVVFCALFMLLTIRIIANGVASGIERWSTRLMPALIVLIIGLIIYIASMPGAAEGWRIYLTPDFSQIMNPDLLLNALGQAFFSLSLGVGTMMIYGSYINKKEHLPKLGATVALMDVGIAFMAGCLVIPAMYVALHNGVVIYNEAGQLIDSDGLIFTVLPELFDSIGFAGSVVAVFFFALMSIAALTSSISLLEVPVAYAVENRQIPRKKAAWCVGALILLISTVIIFNFSTLFGGVITFTTRFSEPLIGLLFCLYIGWIWRRDQILQEIKQGMPSVESSLFWKIWPSYVRYVCPLVILALFWRTLTG